MVVTHGDKSQAIIDTAIKQRERLRSGRSQTAAVLTLLGLASVGLLLALVVGSAHANGVPTCNSQPMSQTDVCDVFASNGGGGTFTYQQMLDRESAEDTHWQVIGWVMTVVCLLLIVPVVGNLSPSKPWGQPVTAACPRCGRQTTQERLTTHTIRRGRTTYSYTGKVTLCTPECGYATVRRS